MIGKMLFPMTAATGIPGADRLLDLIQQMQSRGADAITQWPPLAREAKKLEPILSPSAALVSPAKTSVLKKVKFWGKTG